MIVRENPGRLEWLFALRGSVVPVIAPRVALLMLISAAIIWLHGESSFLPQIDEFGFTVFGIALSLFLGFRNNAAYDRWWEARKLWGGLLADLRSLAREARVFVHDDQLRESLVRLSLGFLHLHRQNLRSVSDPEDVCRWADGLEGDRAPCGALDGAAELIANGQVNRRIDGFGARALSERLASIAFHQAGCERIASTPLPFVYSLLIYRTTYAYCLLLPLAMAGGAGWLTPIFVGVVGYVFLGLAEVSEELSQPFGTTPNALPLDAMCRAAEISLAPHLGELPPEPLKANDYYLS